MNRTIKVACDLFLNLKLYQLPDRNLKILKEKFPNVEIQRANLPNEELKISPDTEVYFGNRITPEIISSLPNLKWIHFGSVGVNRAETQEVIDRGIIVTNSRDIMTAAVAGSALAMMLALARGLHHCWNLRVEKRLSRESYDEYYDQTHELENQRCLIVGFGQIGKRVARVCMALGMIVDVVGRTREKNHEEINGNVYTLDDLNNAVRESDYVINLLPLTKLTAKIYDKNIFNSMKKTAFFINLGRGESVCEQHLVEAIKSKEIAGAGLDVFEKEPLASNSELWNLKEVIITPHLGGLTNRYWDKQIVLFEENLVRYIRGENLLNVVDMKKGY